MATLFRPVGLHELSLLWDSNFRKFPPRLAHQPFFYPVTSAEYAAQIAAQWNVDDEASGFSGFVTQFRVADGYVSNFEPHVVGTGVHMEYWIPAEQLDSFNHAISDAISVREAFFGPRFVGYIPEGYGLRGKGAIEQFVILAKTWDYSGMDFVCEVSANRKAIYINSHFWVHHDFAAFGIDSERKRNVMDRLRQEWESDQVRIPLPAFPKGE
jgi:hypothetical protein